MRTLRQDFIAIFSILMRRSKGAGTDLFVLLTSSRTQGNDVELSGRFRLDIRKNGWSLEQVVASSLSSRSVFLAMLSGTWWDTWGLLHRARSWAQWLWWISIFCDFNNDFLAGTETVLWRYPPVSVTWPPASWRAFGAAGPPFSWLPWSPMWSITAANKIRRAWAQPLWFLLWFLLHMDSSGSRGVCTWTTTNDTRWGARHLIHTGSCWIRGKRRGAVLLPCGTRVAVLPATLLLRDACVLGPGCCCFKQHLQALTEPWVQGLL